MNEASQGAELKPAKPEQSPLPQKQESVWTLVLGAICIAVATVLFGACKIYALPEWGVYLFYGPIIWPGFAPHFSHLSAFWGYCLFFCCVFFWSFILWLAILWLAFRASIQSKLVCLGCAILGIILSWGGFVTVNFPSMRAREYSGPGIPGRLMTLQLAKAQWERDHKDGPEWPSQNDLLPYLQARRNTTNSFDQIVRPIRGEVYLINRTGQPVFAYFPSGGRKGQILTLTSNDLTYVQQQLE